MADSTKDLTVSSDKPPIVTRLRYPLRSSGSKQKTDVSPTANASKSPAANRGSKMASSVTKSVNGSTRPPRRLSVPSKSSTPSSVSKPLISTTPVSHKGSENSKNKSGGNTTPISDISKSSSRLKFNTLASRSYWLSHIKLSESSEKHSVSLGFFKLALESGCESLRDELKAYMKKHSLWNMGGIVKEVMSMYNIVESLEEMPVSESCNGVVPSSDEDVNSSTSSTRGRRGIIKPKSLKNTNGFHASPELRKENKVLRTSASSVRGSSISNPNIKSDSIKAVKNPESKINKKNNKKQNTEKNAKNMSLPTTKIDGETTDLKENKENVVEGKV